MIEALIIKHYITLREVRPSFIMFLIEINFWKISELYGILNDIFL